MTITAKGRRWEILHSLWIGWTFTLGIFSWIAFSYIGFRVKQRKWILWGVFYLIPVTLVVILALAGAPPALGAPALLVTFLLGIVSIFHAFKVRNEYLLRLQGSLQRTVERDAALKYRISAEYEADTGTSNPSQTTAAPKPADLPIRNRPQEQSTASPQTTAYSSPTAVPTPSSIDAYIVSGQIKEHRPGSIPTSANYPLPLAYSYRLAEAEFETLRVLKELYRNAENLTAFLASLALALAPTPTGRGKDQLLRAWRGGATFGNWFHVLGRGTTLIDEERGQLYRSTKRLLGTQENPTPFAENIRWLMDRRNDFHHRDLPVGKEAEELVREVRERFERCVSETEPIWQHPLRLVLDYDAIRNSEYVLATCLDYTGDHPAGRKVQEKYRGVPKKQDLYILQNGEEWISLYPFVSVHYCRHCNARETYFVGGWAGPEEEADLLSFERAHQQRSHEIGQELTKWLRPNEPASRV